MAPSPRRHTRPPRRAPARLPRGLAIVHEDRDLLVVDKPAGLLSIATATEKRRTVYAALREHVAAKRPPERVFVVHRLDRDASGLLVFAKTPEAKRRLQRQFAERTAHRVYLALVEGRLDGDERTIRSYLRESAARKSHSTADEGRGRLAVTHLRVLGRSRHATRLEVRLETGRKHQIRAHLAEQGHPIVGDRRYGSRSDPLRRLALHAARLSFRHPVTGELLELASPPPVAFGGVFRRRPAGTGRDAVRPPRGRAGRPAGGAGEARYRGAPRARPGSR